MMKNISGSLIDPALFQIRVKIVRATGDAAKNDPKNNHGTSAANQKGDHGDSRYPDTWIEKQESDTDLGFHVLHVDRIHRQGKAG